MPLRFFYADRPEKLAFEKDTMPDENFRQHDLTRKKSAVDWSVLGPIGSAARPQFFEISRKNGWHSGFSAFDIYEKQPEDLKFFKNPKAFSEAFYARGIDKTDAQFRGKFARTFAGGSSISLDFAQHNGAGQLRHEKTRNTAFLAGVRVPVGSRWEGYLIFARNRHRQQENFGFIDEKEFGIGGVPGGGLEIEVFAEDPVTRLDRTELRFIQNFDFVKKQKAPPAPDSLQKPAFLQQKQPQTLRNSAFSIQHSASIWRERFLFFDPNSSDDSSLYGLFWADERGLRHFLQASKLENRLRLEGLKSRFGGIEAGLTHGFWRLDEEPGGSNFQQLFLNGRAELNLRNSLKINALADLGLLKNAGEFVVAGDLEWSVGRLGELRGRLLQQRRQPSFVSQKLQISQVPIWANDFSKINESSLAAALEIFPTRTIVEARQHVVAGFVFFDEKGQPSQLGDALSVTQLLVNQRVTFWKIKFDATAGAQNVSKKDALRLPRFWAKASLFYEGRLFKNNLHLTLGTEARLANEFLPEAWQPATGQFFVQNSDAAAFFPTLDPFVAFKVKTWRFFLRYDNLPALWSADIFETVARRAMPRQALRLGVSIRWLDGKKDDQKSSQNAPTGGNGRPPTGVGRGF